MPMSGRTMIASTDLRRPLSLGGPMTFMSAACSTASIAETACTQCP